MDILKELNELEQLLANTTKNENTSIIVSLKTVKNETNNDSH